MGTAAINQHIDNVEKDNSSGQEPVSNNEIANKNTEKNNSVFSLKNAITIAAGTCGGILGTKAILNNKSIGDFYESMGASMIKEEEAELSRKNKKLVSAKIHNKRVKYFYDYPKVQLDAAKVNEITSTMNKYTKVTKRVAIAGILTGAVALTAFVLNKINN